MYGWILLYVKMVWRSTCHWDVSHYLIIFYVDINFVIELHLTIVGIAIFLGHGIGVALNARVWRQDLMYDMNSPNNYVDASIISTR